MAALITNDDSELSLMPTFNDLIDELEIGGIVGVVQLAFPDAAGTPNNTVDGAIAQLFVSGREFDDLDRVTYGGAIQGVAAPYSVDSTTGALQQSSRVYKVGRTTGYTEGNVVGIFSCHAPRVSDTDELSVVAQSAPTTSTTLQWTVFHIGQQLRRGCCGRFAIDWHRRGILVFLCSLVGLTKVSLVDKMLL